MEKQISMIFQFRFSQFALCRNDVYIHIFTTLLLAIHIQASVVLSFVLFTESVLYKPLEINGHLTQNGIINKTKRYTTIGRNMFDFILQ